MGATRIMPALATMGRAAQVVASPRPRSRRGVIWASVLLASICLEGLGRKFLPALPPIAFYLLKDAVLLWGVVAFGIPRATVQICRRLVGGRWVEVAVLGGILWTVLELFNPDQRSFLIGLVGLRSYWLWWLAPFVVASALRGVENRERFVVVLGLLTIGVAVLAFVQFAVPSTSALNVYAANSMDAPVATVSSTGRVRVTSTFSYISGFTDFLTIGPALLLSLGLSARTRRSRAIALSGVVLTIVALPMSGSRSPVLLGSGAVLIVVLTAGFLRTRVGRRVAASVVVGILLAAVFAPDAIGGINDRFASDETRSRLEGTLVYIPPLAVAFSEFPILGRGTGTMQNAAVAQGVGEYLTEYEPVRILLELGLPGYLLVNAARLGAFVALLRIGGILRRVGRKAEGGAAYALAALLPFGHLVFDHVWQALLFLACGLILAAYVDVVHAHSPAERGCGVQAARS